MTGDAILIHSTPTMGIRPLGGSGQRSHALLTRTLADRLDPYAASIFAEPVPSPDGVSIDWYATAEGEVRPFAELQAAEQEPLRADLIGVSERIGALAKALETGEAAADERVAQALRQALKYPDDSFLFVADGRIIVTGWAYELEDASRPSGDLSTWILRPTEEPIEPIRAAPPVSETPAPATEARVAAAAPVPVAVIDRRGSLWWLDLLLWLLLLLLTIVIFWRLLPACEIGLLRQLGLIDGCPAALAATELPDEQRYGDELQNEVERLRRGIAERRYQCRIVGLEPSSRGSAGTPGTGTDEAGLADPADEQEFNERLQRENAGGGDLTVSLKWSTTDDLDLMVTCPSGDIVSFQQRSACGGQLDVDANNNGGQATADPIENVFWPEGNLVPGMYGVGVMLYKRRTGSGSTPIPFQIRVQLGETSRIIAGTAVQERKLKPVTRVDVP